MSMCFCIKYIGLQYIRIYGEMSSTIKIFKEAKGERSEKRGVASNHTSTEIDATLKFLEFDLLG